MGIIARVPHDIDKDAFNQELIRFRMGSQHFFGQFAKRLFVKFGHTREAMLLVQDSLSVLVPLRGCKRSRCKRRLALSDH